MDKPRFRWGLSENRQLRLEEIQAEGRYVPRAHIQRVKGGTYSWMIIRGTEDLEAFHGCEDLAAAVGELARHLGDYSILAFCPGGDGCGQ